MKSALSLPRDVESKIIEALGPGFGTETVDLRESLHRVLAQEVLGDRDSPPFDRAAMDGVALHYDSWTAGTRHFVSRGVLAAGQDPEPFSLSPPNRDRGLCLEIMTGAAVPQGYDTVVRYEDLEKTSQGFQVREISLERGKNVHKRGTDFLKGTILLKPGLRVTSPVLAVLASCGASRVQVQRLPRIALVSTGSELVPVTTVPLPFQIRRSNLYALEGELRSWNCAEVFTAHTSDNPEELKALLAQVLREHDIVIFSGGVSMGLFDLVPGFLKEQGVEVSIHGVAQKPGKPLLVGSLPPSDSRPARLVLGLPGNPVSCLVSLRRYLIPALCPGGGPLAVTLSGDLKPLKGMTWFPAVRFHRAERRAAPVSGHGSGDFYHLSESDGFVEISPGDDLNEEGKLINYYPWGGQ